MSDECAAFEEATVLEPPLFDDDSLVTSPFTMALSGDAPTTIFDPPKRPKMLARGSGVMRSDLERSYAAAMAQFR
ncbi:MAG TPA: hypothetical protein VMZ53_15640 [Kofleriaceae bacterium]|nr:hypothetical protein [Kofleriaceae bacterium]